MESRSDTGERDGTQRWFAGLPSVGVIAPRALLHREAALRALGRVRRERQWLLLGAGLTVVGLASLVRVPVLLCPLAPLLIVSLIFGPAAAARVWRLRHLAQWVDERGFEGTVERFEGLAPNGVRVHFAPQGRRLRLSGGPARLQLDVLTEVGLVLAVDGQAPQLRYGPIQTTSNRLEGSEPGVTRALTQNERIELVDLARHEPTWRALLPGAPAMLPVGWLVRVLFGWSGVWALAALTVFVCVVVAVSDMASTFRRRRQVRDAQRVATVVGGITPRGERVEVLLPHKQLWTIGGRPAPDRLRDRSRALGDALRDTHAPTTF